MNGQQKPGFGVGWVVVGLSLGCLGVMMCGGVLMIGCIGVISTAPAVQNRAAVAPSPKPIDVAAAQEKAKAKNQRAKELLDAYITLLELSEAKVVERVSVKSLDSDATVWEATITVRNTWHIKPYQIRLQDAQTLWEIWSKIASPQNLDAARIRLVDLKGNEVGGSRVLAGSLIWVDEK